MSEIEAFSLNQIPHTLSPAAEALVQFERDYRPALSDAVEIGDEPVVRLLETLFGDASLRLSVALALASSSEGRNDG